MGFRWNEQGNTHRFHHRYMIVYPATLGSRPQTRLGCTLPQIISTDTVTPWILSNGNSRNHGHPVGTVLFFNGAMKNRLVSSSRDHHSISPQVISETKISPMWTPFSRCNPAQALNALPWLPPQTSSVDLFGIPSLRSNCMNWWPSLSRKHGNLFASI